MKKYIIYAFVASTALFHTGCQDFLDVVPDKTQEIGLLFDRRETAFRALATCYNFIPEYDSAYGMLTAGDEFAQPARQSLMPGQYINCGWDTPTSVTMGYWQNPGDWTGRAHSLWSGIRCCNTLIDNIMKVRDMDITEQRVWMAEAQFLKAYYHYFLMTQYGPIPIVDKSLDITASNEEMRQGRATIDELVAYIVNTIDLACEYLPDHIVANNSLGRIDKLIALSLKARVLLYAASPIFNGNSTYYERFVDHDGNKLVNTVYDAEKWKLAADAAKEAITLAESFNLSLYQFTSMDQVPAFDADKIDVPEIKAQYNYRYMMTDRWNSEMVWGCSRILSDWTEIRKATGVKDGTGQNRASGDAWQWLTPSVQVVEAYYTRNGLPMDQDLTFDYQNRYSPVQVGEDNKYSAAQGETTAVMHLDREPRFYASIGFDRGYFRYWGELWTLKIRGGEPNGRTNPEAQDNTMNGYFLQKVHHPSSEASSNRITRYPWPLIRLAELYLNYAEALNEYSGPSTEVYNMLNKVRNRAGIPNVEVVWADATKAKTVGKHLQKDGLREIIQQERRIEFAFEGHRHNDARRWLKGSELDFDTKAWNVDGQTADAFYEMRTVNVYRHTFVTPRDYFWPILNDELLDNPSLVQNPGW